MFGLPDKAGAKRGECKIKYFLIERDEIDDEKNNCTRLTSNDVSLFM